MMHLKGKKWAFHWYGKPIYTSSSSEQDSIILHYLDDEETFLMRKILSLPLAYLVTMESDK